MTAVDVTNRAHTSAAAIIDRRATNPDLSEKHALRGVGATQRRAQNSRQTRQSIPAEKRARTEAAQSP
jgi:hypothetical protein